MRPIPLVAAALCAASVVHPSASAADASAPFTLERELVTNGRVVSHNVVARQPDGTTVRIVSKGVGGNGLTRRTIIRPDGSRTVALDSLGIKLDSPGSPSEPPALDLPANCMSKPRRQLLVGRTELQGVGAVILETPTENDDGTVETRTYWFAPELRCEVLARRYERESPDGTKDVFLEERLVSVTLGAPAADLFAQDDEGYQTADTMSAFENMVRDALGLSK